MENWIPSDKESKLSINGTMSVMEFVLAFYDNNWMAGILGVYFLYTSYKTLKIPGDIDLKKMVMPSIMIAFLFILFLTFLHAVLPVE